MNLIKPHVISMITLILYMIRDNAMKENSLNTIKIMFPDKSRRSF